MRKIAVSIALLGALGMIVPAREAPAQVTFSVSVRIGDFYDELSPYGEWVDCSYGECWVPGGISAGWQPYSNGEWVWTRYGWTWVSDDPWGGDPYHYGTWAFVDRYGWVWVPGTVWAPAWVTWCYSDSYVGWAPIPPTIRFGTSGYSGQPVVVSQTQYVFVPTNQFVGTNVRSARVAPTRNEEIFRQARPATRFEVSGGVIRNTAVPLATVQRATGRRVETREISTARTTPRNLSSGGIARTGQVAIVAPAREMKAARASRENAAPQSQRLRQQARPERQDARPERSARPRQEEARPPRPERPRQEEARPPQMARPRQEEARPPQPERPRQPEARPPRPERPPQEEARPPRPARPQQEEAKPQQAVRPQEPGARPQKPARPPQEARPAGEEHGKSEEKGKKDPPGRDGRPD